LAWLKGQQDVACVKFTDLDRGEYDTRRYLANRSYLRLTLHPLALPWWQHFYPRTQFLAAHIAQKFYRRMACSAVVVFCCLGGGSLLLGATLGRSVATTPLRMSLTLILVVALLVCAVRRQTIYFRTFAVLLALSGLAAGSWVG
jgi:hypothetical protein